MPARLEPGVLYVSQEYETAAHLCACGCGSKVRTPLGPTEWEFIDGPRGPSLWPSIGNWQLPCQAHYFIRDGRLAWSARWSPTEIAEGRAREVHCRDQYYRRLQRNGWIKSALHWLRSLFD